jgi:hypothetical protein
LIAITTLSRIGVSAWPTISSRLIQINDGSWCGRQHHIER